MSDGFVAQHFVELYGMIVGPDRLVMQAGGDGGLADDLPDFLRRRQSEIIVPVALL